MLAKDWRVRIDLASSELEPSIVMDLANLVNLRAHSGASGAKSSQTMARLTSIAATGGNLLTPSEQEAFVAQLMPVCTIIVHEILFAAETDIALFDAKTAFRAVLSARSDVDKALHSKHSGWKAADARGLPTGVVADWFRAQPKLSVHFCSIHESLIVRSRDKPSVRLVDSPTELINAKMFWDAVRAANEAAGLPSGPFWQALQLLSLSASPFCVDLRLQQLTDRIAASAFDASEAIAEVRQFTVSDARAFAPQMQLSGVTDPNEREQIKADNDFARAAHVIRNRSLLQSIATVQLELQSYMHDIISWFACTTDTPAPAASGALQALLTEDRWAVVYFLRALRVAKGVQGLAQLFLRLSHQPYDVIENFVWLLGETRTVRPMLDSEELDIFAILVAPNTGGTTAVKYTAAKMKLEASMFHGNGGANEALQVLEEFRGTFKERHTIACIGALHWMVVKACKLESGTESESASVRRVRESAVKCLAELCPEPKAAKGKTWRWREITEEVAKSSDLRFERKLWAASPSLRTWAEQPSSWLQLHIGYLLQANVMLSAEWRNSWLGELLCRPWDHGAFHFLPGQYNPININKLSHAMGFVGWYTCPNGHLYAVGECTMPMARGKCPSCGSVIGGEHHVPQKGNTKIGAGDEVRAHPSAKDKTGYIYDEIGEASPEGRLDWPTFHVLRFFVNRVLMTALSVGSQSAKDVVGLVYQHHPRHKVLKGLQRWESTVVEVYELLSKRCEHHWQALKSRLGLQDNDLAIGLTQLLCEMGKGASSAQIQFLAEVFVTVKDSEDYAAMLCTYVSNCHSCSHWHHAVQCRAQ